VDYYLSGELTFFLIALQIADGCHFSRDIYDEAAISLVGFG